MTTVNTEDDFTLDHQEVYEKLQTIKEERESEHDAASLRKDNQQADESKSAQSFPLGSFSFQHRPVKQGNLPESMSHSVQGASGFALSFDKQTI